jgi:hypothetical protein
LDPPLPERAGFRVFARLPLCPQRACATRIPVPIQEIFLGDVVKLFRGRRVPGKAIPKPVECKECGDDIETARLQVMPNASRCISCERAWERRFDREMEAVRDHQTVRIIR